MNINSVQQSAYNAYVAKDASDKKGGAKESAQPEAESVNVNFGEAASSSGTYSKPKRLSADEIQALKDSQAEMHANFMRSMMQMNTSNQSQQFMKATQLNFDGVLISASDFELPAGGNTPEEAAKAIAEGGAYSVDAVTDRIFSLAEKLANGDSERLKVLRDAVEEGFSQAGGVFSGKYNSNLPDICNDTYKSIMDKFDALEKKLNPPSDDQQV